MSEEQKAFEEQYVRIYGKFGLDRNKYYPDEYQSKQTRDEFDRWRLTVAAVRYAMESKQ